MNKPGKTILLEPIRSSLPHPHDSIINNPAQFLAPNGVKAAEHLPVRDPRPGQNHFRVPAAANQVIRLNTNEANLRQFSENLNPSMLKYINDSADAYAMQNAKHHVSLADAFADTPPAVPPPWEGWMPTSYGPLPIPNPESRNQQVPIEWHHRSEAGRQSLKADAIFDEGWGDTEGLDRILMFRPGDINISHERHHYDTKDSPVPWDYTELQDPNPVFSEDDFEKLVGPVLKEPITPHLKKWLNSPWEITAEAREAKLKFANRNMSHDEFKSKTHRQAGNLPKEDNRKLWDANHPDVKAGKPMSDKIVNEIFESWMKNDHTLWGDMYRQNPEEFPVEYFKEAIKVSSTEPTAELFPTTLIS